MNFDFTIIKTKSSGLARNFTDRFDVNAFDAHLLARRTLLIKVYDSEVGKDEDVAN